MSPRPTSPKLSPAEKQLADAQAAVTDAERRRAENTAEIQRVTAALGEAESVWRQRIHEHTKLGQRPDVKREKDERDDLASQLEELHEVDAALAEGVKVAEHGVRRVRIERYPELMADHETRCMKIANDRETMEARHQAEQQQQTAAEQEARDYSSFLLEPFGGVYTGNFRDGLIPETRPDRAEASLAAYEPAPWWAEWQIQTWERSKKLAAAEVERLRATGMPIGA